jgi:hypothetical protein
MVRTMYLCRWYSVQYMEVRQNSTYSSTVCAVMSQCPSFVEVGSIQTLKDAHEILMYEWGYQDTRSKYTEVCEVSLTKSLRGKTNLDWKSLGKS